MIKNSLGNALSWLLFYLGGGNLGDPIEMIRILHDYSTTIVIFVCGEDKVIRRAWRSVRLAVRAVSVPYEYKQKQEHLKEEKEKNNIIVFVLNHYNYNYLR